MAAFSTMLLLGLVAGSAAMQIKGQLGSGKAAKQAGDAEGVRLDANAGVADDQATDAIARGAQDESRFRTQVKGVLGSQRAGFAGQGVKVDTGSAGAVTADVAHLGELDALTIRSNAAREAWGFRQQATDLRMQADIARKGGTAAQTASRYAAAGTVLGTGASLLSAKYGFGGGKGKAA